LKVEIIEIIDFIKFNPLKFVLSIGTIRYDGSAPEQYQHGYPADFPPFPQNGSYPPDAPNGANNNNNYNKGNNRQEPDSAGTDSTFNIYVGNLSTHADENDLREVFAPCGRIHSVRVFRDKNSGEHMVRARKRRDWSDESSER
jgi:hypothetical protein